MQPIKKAIIPAAGLGTRFLPATKAMPKEMLPIVDKPTIEYIVDEAIKSGIEDIIIVTGKGKRAIEDHFDHSLELEDNLMQKEKFEQLERIRKSANVDIHYIRQKEPKGLGHAVWCARKFIGDDPFAILLGDDIIQSETPGLQQMIAEHDKTKSSIIGVKSVPDDETHRYGIIDPTGTADKLHQVKNFVEKPEQGTAPSNMAIIGRYILTPEIFDFLEGQKVGAGGEIQLTDAIQELNKNQRVFALEIEGNRYDVGERLSFIQTTIEIALTRDDLRGPLVEYLNELNQKLPKEVSQ
ncbi:UTP--glucose-1-phosphate uridylyltransferase GalU [Lentibacillus cibarius]|uniref:UTP--glucose-1-phosphate uridylyltransferase n=1 Tax=Lentibacillus cibarius TaxID=2583219 RepID=A0A549YFV0_9BACI|nr:UTP--glucose-1-phosphate uridylyltransferase GalU [Lentibacillus cibarius]TMN21962.1 UTP--glucose-1-phosphate uridylyltransferase GalU [Lentibacillus cibarius]TRM10728.1 UTP--glucose-1-phosphate uridylyltransferase GalU [Lentibacillus cibarius]